VLLFILDLIYCCLLGKRQNSSSKKSSKTKTPLVGASNVAEAWQKANKQPNSQEHPVGNLSFIRVLDIFLQSINLCSTNPRSIGLVLLLHLLFFFLFLSPSPSSTTIFFLKRFARRIFEREVALCVASRLSAPIFSLPTQNTRSSPPSQCFATAPSAFVRVLASIGVNSLAPIRNEQNDRSLFHVSYRGAFYHPFVSAYTYFIPSCTYLAIGLFERMGAISAFLISKSLLTPRSPHSSSSLPSSQEIQVAMTHKIVTWTLQKLGAGHHICAHPFTLPAIVHNNFGTGSLLKTKHFTLLT
jgi:hypothetical protein